MPSILILTDPTYGRIPLHRGPDGEWNTILWFPLPEQPCTPDKPRSPILPAE